MEEHASLLAQLMAKTAVCRTAPAQGFGAGVCSCTPQRSRLIDPFLDSRRRLRNGWWITLFLVGMAALVVPATVMASSRGKTVGLPLQALIVIVVTLTLLVIRRESVSTVFGRAATWPSGIASGLGVSVLMWGATAALLWSTGSVSWRLNGDIAGALAQGLADALAVAVVEELVFRGFVFQRLIAGIGTVPAQLAMAAYFTLNHSAGLSHAGDVKVIAISNIFLASLLFGAAYLRTRSLALPIALHFGLNFVQGTVLGFGVSGNAAVGVLTPVLQGAPSWWTGGAFGLEASVPGTAVVVLALVAVWRWSPRGEAKGA